MTITEIKLWQIVNAAGVDETTISTDLLKKTLNEISELKRTRSEAESMARVDGYRQGQYDLRRDLNALLGR